MKSMKKNLLYEYSEILCGKRTNFGVWTLGKNEQERRENVLYLFRFVFQQMYHLTYEEAKEKIKDEEFMKNTHLFSLIKNSNCFVLLSVSGWKVIKDFPFILYVVYHNIDVEKDIIRCFEYLALNCENGQARKIYREELRKIINLVNK